MGAGAGWETEAVIDAPAPNSTGVLGMAEYVEIRRKQKLLIVTEKMKPKENLQINY